MELFKKETNIDFMGIKKYTTGFSIVICLLSIACLFIFKLNLGLEFTGGTQIELRTQKIADLKQIKYELEKINFKDFKIQNQGSAKDVLIRLSNSSSTSEKSLSKRIEKMLNDAGIDGHIKKIEYVGSEVGAQMAEQGGLAVLMAILATMIYIALRFEYRFAVSAALALCHDAIIVLGVFSLFQVEFDLASLAAILAVIGYSLNDTIIIFDRVRENFRKLRKETTISVMNVSINQTLSRTIMTSWLTLLVVLSLLIFSGSSLFGFSLALTVGIIAGTYSSIYVAGAFAINLGLSRKDMLPKPRTEIDEMP